MVGRLVEQQRLGMAEQRLRQQHAHLLAALQLGHRAARAARRGCRGPAAGRRRRSRPSSRPLRRRCPRARRGACRPRRSCRSWRTARRAPSSALHSRSLPMITVSMTRKLSKAYWSWRRTPSLSGRGRRCRVCGVELAGQQLHERGLAGAVRAGQAVAPAGGERGGDVLEEHLRAEPHRDTACRDHPEGFRLCRPLTREEPPIISQQQSSDLCGRRFQSAASLEK